MENIKTISDKPMAPHTKYYKYGHTFAMTDEITMLKIGLFPTSASISRTYEGVFIKSFIKSAEEITESEFMQYYHRAMAIVSVVDFTKKVLKS